MRVLIVKFKNIGDVLLATPLIRNLKLNYQNIKIDVAVNAESATMLAFNPDINKLYRYDRKIIKSLPFFKRGIEELKFISLIKKNRYDMIINLTKGDRGAYIALLTRPKIRIGFRVNMLSKLAFNMGMFKQNNRHTIDWDLDPIRILEKTIYEKKVYIYWDKERDKRIDSLNLPQKFVHFHPVSRWLFKCIDNEIAAKIIDFIESELKLKVIVTSAPNNKELKKIDDILQYTKSSPINLAGKLTLLDTAALNKRALFFVGVDTAIMHIAVANNVPVLAFFGPSGAFHWGPWDNRYMESRYTKKNGFQSMGIHRVIQASWDCVPCGIDGCNGSKISNCLMKNGLDINFIKNNIREIYESTTY